MRVPGPILRCLSFCLSLTVFTGGAIAWAYSPRVEPKTAKSASSVDPSEIRIRVLGGFPSVKVGEKGALKVNGSELSFRFKENRTVISDDSLLAVGNENERVELWGMKGRLMRMLVPDGGGQLVATVMHHRVDMLTLEYRDEKGGYHGAVLQMSTADVQRVLQAVKDLQAHNQEMPVAECTDGQIVPGSVRVPLPVWNQSGIPNAYRAQLYEHTIEKLQKVKGVETVYRDGEVMHQNECPQYTVRMDVNSFHAGSQVARAIIGPLGMFVGTTRVRFDLQVEPTGQSVDTRHIQATMRGDGESMQVADIVAKKVAKDLSMQMKKDKQLRANPR